MPYRPRVTGLMDSLETIINGSRKLFQVATKMNRKIVTIAGASRRSTMVKKMRASPAPSMRAASISSVGTEVCAYTRPRNTPKGLTQEGMRMAHMVLVIPMLWNSTYMGMVRMAMGSNSPDMMMPMAAAFPGKLNFAIAYPAITD